MRLCAPSYYPQFSCTAEHCRHSCCIGWQIRVDDRALARYRALSGDAAKAILSTVTVDGETGEHLFRLAEGGRCPHLSQKGLCRIIERHGDGLLCDICREHPRFYNLTARGAEVGLGAVCEEACRILLTSDGYASFIDVGPWQEDGAPPALDAVAVRERLYAILSDRRIPYPERLRSLWEHADLTACPSEEDGRELLGSLEYLDEAHRALFLSYTPHPRYPEGSEEYLERFLAYLILRHVSPATDDVQLRCALRLCFFCERLYASLLAAGNDPLEAARMLSEEIEYSEDNTEALFLACPFF